MSDVMWTMISMAVIFVLTLGFFAWYFRGFLVPYAKVRMSRGHKLLVKLRNPLVDYYAIGYNDGDVVVVKSKTKTHRLIIDNDSNPFYRLLGVVCFDLDEKTGAIVSRNYKIVSTFDVIQFDNMYAQALSKPAPKNVKEVIILVILVIILLIVLFTAFKVGNIQVQIEALNVAKEVVGVAL